MEVFYVFEKAHGLMENMIIPVGRSILLITKGFMYLTTDGNLDEAIFREVVGTKYLHAKTGSLPMSMDLRVPQQRIWHSVDHV